MFNGLIREIAKVQSFDGVLLTIKAKHKPKIGDSIAVNGACLTVVKFDESGFSVELSPESQSVLAIENYKNLVHIEPAMRLSDRIEGHLIQGHIDCVGVIDKIIKNENSYDFHIKVPKNYIKFIIPKGSIAIDGISLTINAVYEDAFKLTIIPHTMQNSLFKNYKVKSRLNIETDMFARYVHHMFMNKDKKLSWVDVDKIMASY